MTAYDALAKHIEEMRAALDDHECLVASLKERGAAPLLHQCVADCPHKRMLRGTLLETIAVLEESRKSFKSRQIEALRRKLLGVLADMT